MRRFHNINAPPTFQTADATYSNEQDCYTTRQKNFSNKINNGK